MTSQNNAAVSVSTRAPLMPLSLAHQGAVVHVQSITGKDETRRFLGTLGLIEGSEVSVVTEMNGNVIINVKGTRLAISKAMARRVMTA